MKESATTEVWEPHSTEVAGPLDTREPLFDRKVPIAAPTLSATEGLLEEFRRVLNSPQLTNGRWVAELEERAAVALDVPHCVAVSSCTSGLMLVARCLDLEGEVIVPSFTFFATAHSLLWNGLEPVLVDCDPQSFNIDPASVERALTDRTAAILAVHIFGCPARTEALEEIARKKGLPLIFDGAHAFGAQQGGRGVAVWGDATVFSLSPTKPLVAGEGGIIATRHPHLAQRLRQARNYGKGANYDCELVGLNARMTEFQAVVAVAGLPDVEQGIAQRRRLVRIYRSYLDAVPGLRTQAVEGTGVSSWKDFAVVIDPDEFGLSRDQLERLLSSDNIETRRYFDPPLHRQKIYRRYYRPEEDPLSVTDQVSSGVLCLPLYTGLTERTAEAIADRITWLHRNSRFIGVGEATTGVRL